MNLKKGIQVKVITGKDRGKVGEILEIDRKLSRVKIKTINMIKKHLKPTKTVTIKTPRILKQNTLKPYHL